MDTVVYPWYIWLMDMDVRLAQFYDNKCVGGRGEHSVIRCGFCKNFFAPYLTKLRRAITLKPNRKFQLGFGFNRTSPDFCGLRRFRRRSLEVDDFVVEGRTSIRGTSSRVRAADFDRLDFIEGDFIEGE